MSYWTDRTLRLWLPCLLAAGMAACTGAQRSPDASAAAAPTAHSKAPPGLAAAELVEARQRFGAALERMRAGDRAEAQRRLEALLRDFPQFSGPATNLGILHAARGDHVSARRYFEGAVDRKPGNATALNGLGILHREAGAYRQAEDAYLRALEAQPDHAIAHRNIGILYDAYLDQPQRAAQHYLRYLELANDADPIVMVWLRELEARGVLTAAADQEVSR